MITTKEIAYHTPESIWEALGFPDYESYLREYVIKGLFHKNVPEDVIKSYLIVEYIMAHSYYHYPMYDEALSKVLRIAEMAVKLKCKELNIPLEVLKTKPSGEIKKIKKDLDSLINAVSKKEPFRNIREQLHRTRGLRNIFMHPEQFSFGGITMSVPLKGLVVLLNKLFLPETIISNNQNYIEYKTLQIAKFKEGLFALNWRNKKFLVQSFTLCEVAFVENEWLYFCVCEPVLLNLEQQAETHKFSLPFMFTAKQLTVKDDTLSGIEIDSNTAFSITETDHPTNIKTFEKYKEEKELISPENQRSQDLYISYEINKKITAFQYEYHYQMR